MIRRILRFAGLLLVASGFVVAVIDGARWLGTGQVELLPLSTVAGQVFGPRFGRLQPAVEQGAHPLLWQWLFQPFFSLPACLVLFALGFALLWIGRPPAPMIGFAPRA
ncbi:MAG: PetM family of cytochrome b6f complex subunit 7 [Beijerinckiaceae bacterium]